VTDITSCFSATTDTKADRLHFVEESVQKQLDMQIVNHGLKFLSIFIASARIWVDGIEAGMT